MKNLIIIISLIAFPALRGMAQVTTPANSGSSGDYVGWNAGQGFPLEIRHDGSEPMIFYTDGLEWMRLTPAGFLGINTASPSMRFHVHNGGMLSTGTTGTNPNLGAGTVLMWIPDVQAFRAGTAVGTEWNSGNVGTHSFAFGEELTASGDYSVSFGENNESSNTASFSGGLNNTSQGLHSFAYGINNTATGNSSFAVGDSNETVGLRSIAMGFSNITLAQGSIAMGINNTAGDLTIPSATCIALGDDNVAIGHDTFSIGENNQTSGRGAGSLGFDNITNGAAAMSIGLQNSVGTFVAGVPGINCTASFAIGCNDTILSDLSGVLGSFNTIPDGFDESFLIGGRLESGANTTITLGRGLDNNPIINSISRSLMVGFKSDSPTLFVNGGDGTVGSSGNVGIGNITAPTHRLDVNGTARLRVMPTDSMDVIITGVQQDALGDYELNYFEMSGNSTDVLAGDGTWVDINSTVCEWNEVTNGGPSDDLVMGYTGACNQGRVGIGISVPISKLHVNNDLGTLSGTTARVVSNASNATGVVHWGLSSITTGGGASQVAIVGQANATANFGGPTKPLIGVVGSARANYLCGHQAVGVYGEVLNASQTCGSGLAGHFNANILVAGLTINYSDETVKTDLTPISGALEQVLQLKPLSYYFNNDAVGGTAFSSDLAFGLSAQHTQQILPNIVKEVPKPLVRDEEGNLISQEGELLGISYVELIPILISAMQEQQAQIEALSAQVSACCAVAPDQRSGAIPSNDIRIEQSANRLDQNIPNPFDTNTRIGFNLAKDCRVSICIYNSAGQQIDCLIDEHRTSGAHSIEWNTSNLAKGMYFYSLETDGFEQVRRAVKL